MPTSQLSMISSDLQWCTDGAQSASPRAKALLANSPRLSVRYKDATRQISCILTENWPQATGQTRTHTHTHREIRFYKYNFTVVLTLHAYCISFLAFTFAVCEWLILQLRLQISLSPLPW